MLQAESYNLILLTIQLIHSCELTENAAMGFKQSAALLLLAMLAVASKLRIWHPQLLWVLQTLVGLSADIAIYVPPHLRARVPVPKSGFCAQRTAVSGIKTPCAANSCRKCSAHVSQDAFGRICDLQKTGWWAGGVCLDLFLTWSQRLYSCCCHLAGVSVQAAPDCGNPSNCYLCQ